MELTITNLEPSLVPRPGDIFPVPASGSTRVILHQFNKLVIARVALGLHSWLHYTGQYPFGTRKRMATVAPRSAQEEELTIQHPTVRAPLVRADKVTPYQKV